MTPLQKVCLEYGRIHWRAANTHDLMRYLLEQGMMEEANQLAGIKFKAISRAKEVYYQQRKLLQPAWEPPKPAHERLREALDEDDKRREEDRRCRRPN